MIAPRDLSSRPSTLGPRKLELLSEIEEATIEILSRTLTGTPWHRHLATTAMALARDAERAVAHDPPGLAPALLEDHAAWLRDAVAALGS